MTSAAKKVLIADDDTGILDSMRLVLEEFGYAVETTHNGKTVRDIKETFPDVILLDLWMSGVDGRDICAYLKKRRATCHIPVIIVSANRDGAKIAGACGADGFLAKPFEMRELLRVVEAAASRTKA